LPAMLICWQAQPAELATVNVVWFCAVFSGPGGSVVKNREIVAPSLFAVYLGTCVWALWDRLDAILLLAVASPVAAFWRPWLLCP
jgi:hypothetical protein